MSRYLFTSESVSEGHPDKVADQISDAVLDAILSEDKHARVACETMVKTGAVIVADNSIRHAKAMQDYLDYVFKSPDYDSVTFQTTQIKKDGMTITYKLR